MPSDDAADGQLRAVAIRLTDIATTVAHEAEAATATIREMAAHAHQIAQLASELQQAADLVEASVQAQATMLGEARRSMAENEPAIRALAQSTDSVSSISTMIARIAEQSQLLSLNARIEAARAEASGSGFTVVAREMSALSGQTKVATDEIRSRAQAVTRDVEGARRIMISGADLIRTQEQMLAVSLDTSARQRVTATTVTRITAETAAKIDDAAAGIGRVGSTATAVKVLARQIARIANG